MENEKNRALPCKIITRTILLSSYEVKPLVTRKVHEYHCPACGYEISSGNKPDGKEAVCPKCGQKVSFGEENPYEQRLYTA